MAKDTFYFSHDFNARNDIKIKKLIAKHGYLGYGIFWAIIEELYNNTNVLPNDYDCISFDLRCDASVIKSIINDFDLFIVDAESFGSLSIQRRLNERNEKSKKARESVLARWNKLKKDTNVLQMNYDSNTIKERKGKESKGNESKEKGNIKEIESENKNETRFKILNEDFYDELLNSQTWIETVCLQNTPRFNKKEVLTKLLEFKIDLEMRFDKKSNKGEFASHFIRWLK
jgi:hypothetical protein